MVSEIHNVRIERLGSSGDGISDDPGERWFVAGALPGERVSAQAVRRSHAGVHAQMIELDEAAAARTQPPCPHFVDPRHPCGGCALQHLAPAALLRFKRQLIEHALIHRGLEAAAHCVAEPIAVPPHSRRRVTLAAIGRRCGAVLGFHERQSHRIVDLTECTIARPEIVALLTPLRHCLGQWLRQGEQASLQVTVAAGGILVDMTGPRRYPSRKQRTRWRQFADDQGALRITWRPDAKHRFKPLVDRAPPQHMFEEVAIDLPPAAFMQPTAEGESAIREAVTRALPAPPRGRLLECYAGCGSLGLPLASAGWRVSCLEGSAAAVDALRRAARGAALPLTAEQRDLARNPPTAAELAGFDVAIFDPPRKGAPALAPALAASDVATVIAVSCHPGTFARDARSLIDGGYQLAHIQPIDQFPYTTHVELVATFRRHSATDG